MLRLWKRLGRLGVDDRLSTFEAKYVVLCNHTAVLFILLTVPVMVLPTLHRAPTFGLLVAAVLGRLVTLVLNSAHRHSTARLFFAIWETATPFAMSLMLPRATDWSFLLIAVASGTWLLFPKNEWGRAALVSASAIALFYALEWRYSHGGALLEWDAEIVAQLSIIDRSVVCAGLVSVGVYSFLSTSRAVEQVETERNKSRSLLLNVLPKAIADRLLERPGTIADRFDGATVLFADIVHFTLLAERVSATELVKMLDEIFTGFDQLAEKHGLEKIKTIGDAYMVAGGIPVERADHAQAIARMALEMPAVLARMSGEAAVLNIRIGLDTGPVVAGVIGRKKFSYDLWGDTVNTASRMESHGQAGRIHCTQAVYDKLSDGFDFEPRGAIEVKGKGQLTTFFLTGPKHSTARGTGSATSVESDSPAREAS